MRASTPEIKRKTLARQALQRIVLAEMRELLAAQIANAKGLRYLVTRDRFSGKFVRVTAERLAEMEDPEARAEIVEVWQKEPSIQAFTDLMNRALDKPKEQPTEVEHTGGLVIRHELVMAPAPPALPPAQAVRPVIDLADALLGEGE